MATHRKVTIKGVHKVPINEQAFKRLIRYYYKGPHNIEVNFDDRTAAWGKHTYCSTSRTHRIDISPKWCGHEQKGFQSLEFEELTANYELQQLSEYDTMCRIIQTVLHELKHAMQCDKNPIRYAKCADDRHPKITNTYLKYKLSMLETEAEGWSLLHVNRAIARYESWLNGTKDN